MMVSPSTNSTFDIEKYYCNFSFVMINLLLHYVKVGVVNPKVFGSINYEQSHAQKVNN